MRRYDQRPSAATPRGDSWAQQRAVLHLACLLALVVAWVLIRHRIGDRRNGDRVDTLDPDSATDILGVADRRGATDAAGAGLDGTRTCLAARLARSSGRDLAAGT